MRKLTELDITVSRNKLLDILKENYQKHCTEYEAAKVRYRVFAIKQLKERLDQLQDPGEWRTLKLSTYLSFRAAPPPTYAKDYQDVIDLLEMCEDAKISISAHQFRCWCKDDWDWKPEFMKMSQAY